jgi:hypothetical protein
MLGNRTEHGVELKIDGTRYRAGGKPERREPFGT